jgi:hypothetical protein
MPVISVRDLVKTYEVGEVQVHALRGVSLDIEVRSQPSGAGPRSLASGVCCAGWTSPEVTASLA